MASGLPPPPTRAESGDFAWVAWYNQLYSLLSSTGAVAWSQVSKAGSSIADLQNHNHNLLTSIDGNGTYHLSATEQARVAGVITKAGDPTTTDIAAGTWAIYKNTSSGAVKLWTNDGGTMKSVSLI
jgi:hypothetical protein